MKLSNIALVCLMLFSAIMGDIVPVNAATYQPVNLDTISGTGADVKLGNNSAYLRDGIGKISVNGEIAFCIEPINYFLLNINS